MYKLKNKKYLYYEIINLSLSISIIAILLINNYKLEKEKAMIENEINYINKVIYPKIINIKQINK